MVERKEALPPGWDAKFDVRTGRWYFINHYTKTTTFEDPRTASYKPAPGCCSSIGEYIPLQHGSPDLKRNYVYPSQSSPIPAFQIPGQWQKYMPLQVQEMKNTLRSSPLLVRSAKVQDTTFITFDVEESVAKISAMFPTASETHIRILLKKYHNREAVVISALQVERHPLTTPGPFSTPPPITRASQNGIAGKGLSWDSPGSRLGGGGAGSANSSSYTGSPKVTMSSGSVVAVRPHSSPKLKLSRYMKSIFPQAEETVILDILSSNENNIQKSSEKLKEMGFVRKDTIKLNKLALEAKVAEEIAKKELAAITAASPPPLKKLTTLVEKAKMLNNIKEKYTDIPDRVISLALESVEYDEIRANQILQIMVQDDNAKPKDEMYTKNSDTVNDLMDHIQVPNTVSTSQSRTSLKSLLKTKDKLRLSCAAVEENNTMNNGDYKGGYQSQVLGANASIVNGPNEKLLLEDYVKWQGPDRTLIHGSKPSLAIGPNKDLISKRSYQPCGSNSSLCKGRQFGLAKGSIFAQMNAMSLLDACRGK